FGDLLLLPRTNNTIATINDFGLSLAIIWILSTNLTYDINAFIMSLVAAAVIGVFEYFFHKYLIKQITPPPKERLHYQTEASEEFHINKPKNYRSKKK
ncbi:DUF2512 family protein, partial [Bacillus sp. JJ722]|uniref:DUF2512 family protein n=1 Tax=Bacillus sp. JJ722 TaxID=3122973 RepID=UPI002FFFC20A